jgi:tetratricopeptide (TPR) repeat protein
MGQERAVKPNSADRVVRSTCSTQNVKGGNMLVKALAGMKVCTSVSILFITSRLVAEPPNVDVLLMPKTEMLQEIESEPVTYNVLELPFCRLASSTETVQVRRASIDRSKFIDIDDAFAFYSRIIKLRTNDPWAWTMRAVTTLRTTGGAESLESVLNDVSAAIERDPTYVPAYHVRGLVAYCNRDYTSSVEQFDTALSIDPTSAATFLGRGIARRAQHEHRKAVSDFNEAIRLDSTLSIAFEERGFTFACVENDRRAIADIEIAVALDSSNTDPLYCYLRELLSNKVCGFDAVRSQICTYKRAHLKRRAPRVILISGAAAENNMIIQSE